MSNILLKRLFTYLSLFFIAGLIGLSGCKDDDIGPVDDYDVNIEILSPTTGTVYQYGDSIYFDLTLSSLGTIYHVKVEVIDKLDNSSDVLFDENINDGDGTYGLTLIDLNRTAGDYELKVTTSDNDQQNEREASVDFSITFSGFEAEVTISNPLNGTVFMMGDTVEIDAEISSPQTIGQVIMNLTNLSDNSFQTIYDETIDATNVTFNIGANYVPSVAGDFMLTVRAFNFDGSESEQNSVNYTIQ